MTRNQWWRLAALRTVASWVTPRQPSYTARALIHYENRLRRAIALSAYYAAVSATVAPALS